MFRKHLTGWAFFISATILTNFSWWFFYQKLSFEIETQKQRAERLQDMVSATISTSENAIKIEMMEQRLEKIDGRLSEMTIVLKSNSSEK